MPCGEFGGEFDVGNSVFQIEIPAKFHNLLLTPIRPHDQSGHLGIRKTYDHVVQCCFASANKGCANIHLDI